MNSSSCKVSLLFVLMWALLIQTTGCGNSNVSSLTDDTMTTIRSTPPTVEISHPIEAEIYEPDIYSFPADADVLAYYVDWNDSATCFSAYANCISSVSIDSYYVDQEGNVRGDTPTDFLEEAKTAGVEAYLCVTNYADGWDSDCAHSILSDTTARDNCITNLIDICVQNDYFGINIDWENIYPADRTLFSGFIEELSDRCGENAISLIVSIPAKAFEDLTNTWSGAFDYAALGQSADMLQIMTYDQHYSGGPAGPIAGLYWVRSVLDYAVSLVSPSKISLGIPAYGCDWELGRSGGAHSFILSEVDDLLSDNTSSLHWSDTCASPWIRYQADDGTTHIAWFENRDSIEAKLSLVGEYHLVGISIWNLGSGNSDFWAAVQS